LNQLNNLVIIIKYLVLIKESLMIIVKYLMNITKSFNSVLSDI